MTRKARGTRNRLSDSHSIFVRLESVVHDVPVAQVVVEVLEACLVVHDVHLQLLSASF